MAEVVLFEIQAEIGNLTKELDLIKAKLGQLDKEAVDTGDALDKMGKEGVDAAKKVGKQVDNTTKEVKGLTAQVQKFGQQATQATNKFIESQGGAKGILKEVGTALGLAYGISAVVEFGKASVEAFLEAQQNAQLLLNALNGNEQVQQRLIDQSAELQKKTIYSDDSIQAAQTYLATQGRTEIQIKKTIVAATNLAAVTGDNLQSAVEKLDMTYEGSIGRLGRLDDRFKTLTQEQLSNGAAVDLINDKYNGFSEAAATTYSGKIQKLKNEFGDLQEVVGDFIVTQAVLATELPKSVENITSGSSVDIATAFIPESAKIKKNQFNQIFALTKAFEALKVGGKEANIVYSEASKQFELTTTQVDLLSNSLNDLGKSGQDNTNIYKTLYSEFGLTKNQVDNFYQELKKLNKETESSPKTIGELEVQLSKYQKALKDVQPRSAEFYAIQSKINEIQKQLGKNTATVKTEMQLLNEQLTAVTTNIENTIARGGVVSEKDVMRAARLKEEIKRINEERDRLIGRASTSPISGLESVGTTMLPGGTELNPEKSPEVLAQEAIIKALEERYAIEEELRQKNLEEEKKAIEERKQLVIGLVSQALNAASQIAQSITDAIQQDTQQRIAALEKERDARLNNANLTNKKRAQIEKEFDEKILQEKRKQWETEQAAKILQAGINTAVGITQAFAQTGIGGFITGALIAAAGAAQIAAIAGAENPYFEGTAFVERGKNPRGRDTIPARLNEGEAVIPTDKNAKYPGMAQAWIDGRLDDYIMKQFVAPKLSEMERSVKAESMSAMFDDFRLFRTMNEGNNIARDGFGEIVKNMKQNGRRHLL